jgi:hypothetical protein
VWCSSESWLISSYCTVISSIRSKWYFHLPSPPSVASYIVTRHGVFINGNTRTYVFSESPLLLSSCLLSHDWCYGYEDFPWAVVIQYYFSRFIPRRCQMWATILVILKFWKVCVLKSRKFIIYFVPCVEQICGNFGSHNMAAKGSAFFSCFDILLWQSSDVRKRF